MIYKILLFSFLFSFIILLTYKLGKTKKQLEIIKQEKEKIEKELMYVQETATIIHNLNSQSVNDKLQQIANKEW